MNIWFAVLKYDALLYFACYPHPIAFPFLSAGSKLNLGEQGTGARAIFLLRVAVQKKRKKDKEKKKMTQPNGAGRSQHTPYVVGLTDSGKVFGFI